MTSSISHVNCYSTMFNTFIYSSLKQNKCLCSYLFDKYGESTYYYDVSIPVDDRPCNMSCYTVLKRQYDTLNGCLDNASSSSSSSDNLTNDEILKFNQKWSESFLYDFPQATDFYGFSIYHYCASNNNLKLFECAYRKYPNAVNLIDAKGMTILMRACQKKHFNFVKFLLENTRANVNGSELCMQTPLVSAIMNQCDALVEILLKYKANPSRMPYVDKNVSMSPLKCSIVYNRLDSMCLLLKYGANPLDELLLNDSPNSYTTLLRLFYKNFDGRNFKYMIVLNNFIQNANVYRHIFFSYFKTKSIDHVPPQDDVTIDRLFKMFIEHNQIVEHKTLEFEFLAKLLDNFYRPKSLRELCRFEMRKLLKFNLNLVDLLVIPSVLKQYIKFE